MSSCNQGRVTEPKPRCRCYTLDYPAYSRLTGPIRNRRDAVMDALEWLSYERGVMMVYTSVAEAAQKLQSSTLEAAERQTSSAPEDAQTQASTRKSGQRQTGLAAEDESETDKQSDTANSDQDSFYTAGGYHSEDLRVLNGDFQETELNYVSKCLRGSILYVDAFDSFSNNIVALLESTLNARVTIIAANAPIADLSRVLACFDAVVLGPGPGDPTTSKEIELFKRILEAEDLDCKPVLGICLGFQKIAVTFGAALERLTNPKHGMITEIHHSPESIFGFYASFEATQYHSLRVKIGHPLEIARPILRPIGLWRHQELYTATQMCPFLGPLAWDVDDSANGGVLMALEHLEKPFWGIQFHPESICTSPRAPEILRNWWRMALQHNHFTKKFNSYESMSNDTLDGTAIHGLPRDISLHRRAAHWSSISAPLAYLKASKKHRQRGPRKVCTTRLGMGHLTAIEVSETLRLSGYENIFLESVISRPEVGRYSIIGIIEAGQTNILEYTSGQSSLDITLAKAKSHSTELLRTVHFKPGQTIWDFLAGYMELYKAVGGDASSPFWGGLIGYLSYESGTVPDQCTENCAGRRWKKSPDTVFAYVEKSLVFDNVTNKVYIQSIKARDGVWIKSMTDTLRRLVSELQARKAQRGLSDEQRRLRSFLEPAIIQRPSENDYRERIRRAMEYIRAGDSYELCLTDQAHVVIPKQDEDFAWALYKSLRTKNPAPFAAYLHLSDTVIISSSPERFLSWDRDGTCQLRPIKGTVKKGPDMSKEKATRILGEEKEQAENLMIVDLIRHDLHGIVGAGNVQVKKLMVVEEYETVYQLVSVIEGQVHDVKPRTFGPDPKHPQSPTKTPTRARREPEAAAISAVTASPGSEDATPPPPFIGYTGLDVLRAALPPGSMTGAPKRSSCDILHHLEGHRPRGIYSGVLGYMCAGGGGDFSVLIRCAYRDDKRIVTTKAPNAEPVKGKRIDRIKNEVWCIGAGGAITALSDDLAEWEEMNVKLESTLAVFEAEDSSRAAASSTLGGVSGERDAGTSPIGHV